MTEVGVGEGSSELPTRGLGSTPKKNTGSDSNTNEYFVQSEGLVASSAVQMEESVLETSQYGVKSNAEIPLPTIGFSHSQVVDSPLTSSRIRDGIMNNSTADSIASFMTDFSRTRRRRRREQLALEDPVEGEKQRQELERALQSLEEMQRENKERMRHAESEVFSSKAQSPNERGAGDRHFAPLMFSRTQSVGVKPPHDARKHNLLERAMTSLIMPEFNKPTSPEARSRIKSFSNDAKSPPVRRSHVSPPHAKKGGPFRNIHHRVSTTHLNVKEKSRGEYSPGSSVMLKVESANEKWSPLRVQTVPTSRGSVELRSGSDRWCGPKVTNGGGKVDTSGMRVHSSTSVLREDARLSPEVNKSAKKTPTSGKRIAVGRPFGRPGGRSTSPPIIILTVDSRKNMGEEDARRLLSGERMRTQEHHTRVSRRGSEKRHSGTAVSLKHTSDMSLKRFSVVNERSSTGLVSPRSSKETEKESKKTLHPHEPKVPYTNSPASSAVPSISTSAHGPPPPSASGPVFAAFLSSAAHLALETTTTVANTSTSITATGSKQRNDNGRVKVDGTHDIPSNSPLHTRACSLTDVHVLPHGTKKKKTSLNEVSPIHSSTNKSQLEKNNTIFSKAALVDDAPAITTTTTATTTANSPAPAAAPSHAAAAVAATAERRLKVQVQKELRNGNLARESSGMLGVAAVPKRRVGSGTNRTTTSRRDDLVLAQEKEGQHGTKTTSSQQVSEAGTNASQRSHWQHLSLGRKSLSALTRTGTLDRDALRPLATDRPAVTRTRTGRQTSINEPISMKQPVPFCTECGKRHIDAKVKFCAFCGHKREAV